MIQTITQLGGRIPADWNLVPVNGNKRPVDPLTGGGLKNWQHSSYDTTDFPFDSPYVKAIGVLTGSKSNGLLVVDIDSQDGQHLLETISGKTLSDFPPTIACTSGKPGTQKLFYRIPSSKQWGQIRTAHMKGLDFLWDGCQAVLSGVHPTTGSYRWVEGCGPEQVECADAPDWLIASVSEYCSKAKGATKSGIGGGMVDGPQKSQGRIQRHITLDLDRDLHVARRTLQQLDPVAHESYGDWLKVGMCLHSTSPDLLDDWIDWSSQMSNFDEEECCIKWQSFHDCDSYREKTGRPALGLGSLLRMGTKPTHSKHNAQILKEIQDKRNGNQALLSYLRTLSIRYNELRRRVEMDGELLQQDPRYFYLHLTETTGLNIGRELARDALMTVAHENTFNPVAEYLLSVQPLASNTDPISDTEIASWFGFNPEDYVSIELTRTHLRACAMRGVQPGSKMDSVLILSGPMGYRKSTAIKTLAPDPSWYDETTRLDIDNKDSLSSMNSAWIFELSEIDKLTSARESSVLKAWISRGSDNYVEKYESITTEHPRRACLWGSTNAGAFLNDPTGSRRFWITFVESICDVDSLEANRDRLWAHSLHEAQNGYPHYLEPTDGLMVEANKRGSNATLTDPWQEKLQSLLERHESGTFLSTQNLFALIDRGTTHEYGMSSEIQTLEIHNQFDARRLASAMNALGWRNARNSKERGYVKL